MPAQKVQDFLDSRDVRYITLKHSRAYTAQEIAARSHISGRDFAKTVIVFANGNMAMVVLPAHQRIHLPELRDMLGTLDVHLATESEFRATFPDCELGAMPPFGNLYNLPVYVAGPLAEEEEIAFNAGTHTEVIQMRYADFEELVKPEVLEFITA
ncbi:aminoacyl-tRNA deacylase [Actomonas aquatica]|uniref:YbaK/EbsC family protein n=1 Tax=Actomonas aquatica TaxID=2866162 RepID=A0ABZ1C9N5_9BACT|nr:YbaK/EbsC family protein [Opitutus sp. WL0086]WRQ88112.1 YbaK/EbsC family protein [Opitutus sp. WL0086]